jgi:hypothetical protein
LGIGNGPWNFRIRFRIVRFGSKADIRTAKSYVRFTPKSGHAARQRPCPLRGGIHRIVWKQISPLQKHEQPDISLRLHASIRRQLNQGASDALSIATESESGTLNPQRVRSVLLAPPSPISPEEPAATLTTSEGSRAVMREPWQPFFFLVADRFGMLSRVRNSRGRPLNAPDAFIHPCRPTVTAQPPSGPGWVHNYAASREQAMRYFKARYLGPSN